MVGSARGNGKNMSKRNVFSNSFSHWKNFNYTVEQNEQMIELIIKQIEKHQNHKFVEEYFDERLRNLQQK